MVIVTKHTGSRAHLSCGGDSIKLHAKRQYQRHNMLSIAHTHPPHPLTLITELYRSQRIRKRTSCASTSHAVQTANGSGYTLSRSREPSMRPEPEDES
jgi:hypothetical protein